MVENCKKALDQENKYGALVTDLSKAFDCLPHNLMVVKLHAYGFFLELLKLIKTQQTFQRRFNVAFRLI